MTIYINLFPWREQQKNKNRWILLWGSLFNSLLFLFIVGVTSQYFRHQLKIQNQANQSMQKAIKAQSLPLAKADSWHQQKIALRSQLQAAAARQQDRFMLVRLLEAMVRATPKEMVLTYFAWVQQSILIEGEALSHSAIAAFVRYLEAVEVNQRALLMPIKMTISSAKLNNTKTNHLRFSVQTSLNCPKPDLLE